MIFSVVFAPLEGFTRADTEREFRTTTRLVSGWTGLRCSKREAIFYCAGVPKCVPEYVPKSQDPFQDEETVPGGEKRRMPPKIAR